MALLAFEGFDAREPAGRVGLTLTNVTPSFVTGRLSGYAVSTTSPSGELQVRFSHTASATTIASAAFKMPSTAFGSAQGDIILMKGDAGVTTHINLRVAAAGVIDLRRGEGGSVIASSASGVIVGSTWHRIEVKATIADSGGTCVVKVDGVTVINYTGDTKNGGTNTTLDLQEWRLARDAGSGGAALDDVVILDGTGSAPLNDFLGDVRVETLAPNGNGNESDLVGSDGNSTDNYLLVDETPASASDYVKSATAGDRDLYVHGNLATTSGTVYAVQVHANAQKSDAGAASFIPVTRSASVEFEDTSKALSTSAAYVSSGIQLTDPSAAAWTISSVNAAEFGVEVA